MKKLSLSILKITSEILKQSTEEPFHALYSPEEKYVKVPISEEKIKKYQDILKEKIGKQPIEEKEQQRGLEHHVTLVSPPEIKEIKKAKKLDEFLALDFAKISTNDLKFVGIGKAEEGENKVYFIVVDWPSGKDFRMKLKEQGFPLGKQDFHITLGFNKKDLFGVDKSTTALVPELQLKEETL